MTRLSPLAAGLLALCLSATTAPHALAQQAGGGTAARYSLLLKGGHVLDPKNGVDAVMDVAIADGKIAAVAAGIDPALAARVADVSGLYVVPGLIDLHAHVFVGTEPDHYLSNGDVAVRADSHSFRSGQTTLVDVGGPGWRNLATFRRNVVDTSRTRVLTFMNIVGHGMRGEPWEQDLGDMDPKLTAQRIRANRDIVVGIKVAHYLGSDWDPITRAVEAGREADVPVMIDFGRNEPHQSLDTLLNTHLRPGDILTHMYADVTGRATIVNAQGQVEPFVLAARKRGVIFDVGHGGGSFFFRQAVPATQQGFYPDVISTDLHTGSQNAGMKNILNVMSKLLNLKMPLADVVRANTATAAGIIKRPELGHLGVGAEADVAVLAVRTGQFGFLDSGGSRMPGTQSLECELTVKGGQVVWDLNGRAATPWREQPVENMDAPPRRRQTAQAAASDGVIVSRRMDADVPAAADPSAPHWRDVPAVTLDRNYLGEPIAGRPTEVRSRWTPTHLYLLYTCPYDTLTLRPQLETAKETPQLWNWDVAEAFIGWDTGTITRYKEFQVSPRGEWVDLDIDRANQKGQAGMAWDSGFTVAARVDERAKVWYGEMRIPFTAIDTRTPEVGRTLRAGLYRIAGADPRTFYAWQPTGQRNFHVPEAFGTLRLQ